MSKFRPINREMDFLMPLGSSPHPAKLSNTALNAGQVLPQFGPTPP